MMVAMCGATITGGGKPPPGVDGELSGDHAAGIRDRTLYQPPSGSPSDAGRGDGAIRLSGVRTRRRFRHDCSAP